MSTTTTTRTVQLDSQGQIIGVIERRESNAAPDARTPPRPGEVIERMIVRDGDGRFAGVRERSLTADEAVLAEYRSRLQRDVATEVSKRLSRLDGEEGEAIAEVQARYRQARRVAAERIPLSVAAREQNIRERAEAVFSSLVESSHDPRLTGIFFRFRCEWPAAYGLPPADGDTVASMVIARAQADKALWARSQWTGLDLIIEQKA